MVCELIYKAVDLIFHTLINQSMNLDAVGFIFSKPLILQFSSNFATGPKSMWVTQLGVNRAEQMVVSDRTDPGQTAHHLIFVVTAIVCLWQP